MQHDTLILSRELSSFLLFKAPQVSDTFFQFIGEIFLEILMRGGDRGQKNSEQASQHISRFA